MSDLTLYNLGPSPNNVKVRLALGLKELQAEIVDIDPMDRSEVVRVSGQPLTPVLVDRGRVVYDSYGILRYLDANFDGPKLFDDTRERQQEIERWELFTRTEIGPVVGMIFGQFFAPEKSDRQIADANQLLFERTEKLETALASNDYLMGDAPNAADLSVASFVGLSILDTARFEAGSIQHFFAEHFRLTDARPRTAAWTERVMALDR